MNSKPTPQAQGKRPSIIFPVALVGIALVVGALFLKRNQSQPPPGPTAVETSTPAPVSSPVRPVVPRPETTEATVAPAPVAATVPGTAVKPTPAPIRSSVPDVDAHQLMSGITTLDTNAPITADAAQKWKDNLQQLVRQGASSVPAIHDYLAQNLDVNFAGVPGADQLGYSSLRSALLNALGQIAGPESTALMLQTLQTSVYPTDVATIAGILEQQSPGQYSSDVLAAARTQLAAAAQDQLGNANVGPLFQLLANAAAGGTDVSADLAQYGSKWPFYASIELASLPNGQGLPALVQLAQNSSSGAQSAAVESLAQMAPGNTQALDSLVSLAKQGAIPDGILAQLAPYLGGRENQLGGANNPPGTPTQGLFISNGNQNFSAADLLNSLTPNQINQRLTIIDQLLAAIPPGDTLSQNALQQQKGVLTGRLAK
jgi:hypothetical protein